MIKGCLSRQCALLIETAVDSTKAVSDLIAWLSPVDENVDGFSGFSSTVSSFRAMLMKMVMVLAHFRQQIRQRIVD